MEHFRNDGMLDASRTQCNCESCCAHNMLKLSKGLFQITGKKKYADYYERTLRNAIMGAINPQTGATTYFSPMATGYYKVFGKPDPADSMMWCCTGIGMENFTKLGDSVYFKDGDTLYVNQYITSEVLWEERNMLLKQYADIEADNKAMFMIELVGKKQIKEAVFKLRKPDWVKGEVTVAVSGMESTDYCVVEGKDGYLRVKGMWRHGAVITIQLPMTVEAIGLPDCDNVLGFRYGVTVLAAKLGKWKMEEQTWAGIDLSAPAWKFVGGSGVKMDIAYAQTQTGILETELLTLNPGITLIEFKQNIHEHLLKREGQDGVEFVLKGTNAENILGHELVFVPYNQITDERYGIYWYFNAL